MNHRREFLKMAGVFCVTAACNPEKLFGPCASPPLPDPEPPTPRQDVTITKDLDASLAALPHDEPLALHLSGSLETRGCYRWGQLATRNLGKNWTVDGAAEISLKPTDRDSQPLYCLAGPAKRVSGIRTRGNHSQLAKGWPGTLRTGGVCLEGDGSIDQVTFSDFGSWGAETFVAIVTGGSGQASVTRCVFNEFDPSNSDDQVSVYAIMGLEKEPGPLRSFALMEGNETHAPGEGNRVQGHTIYQARKGLVRRNRTYGARFGYYGDFYETKGIRIAGNRFKGTEHGIQLNLSPTPDIGEHFSHEDYDIGWNDIESSGTQVSLNTWGPPTATRFIRGINVHPGLSLESFGAEYTRELRCAA